MFINNKISSPPISLDIAYEFIAINNKYVRRDKSKVNFPIQINQYRVTSLNADNNTT